ncbi:MAG: response regulator [Desulfobacteraceae bacterium]|nr:MAG: response regulator [Desulfobacteraceae bacterium]
MSDEEEQNREFRKCRLKSQRRKAVGSFQVGSIFNFDQGIKMEISYQALDNLSDRVGTGRESSSGEGECILMVDDEQCLRDVAEYVLSKLGYRVLLAADGESAIQLYREGKNNISLIVLDLIMPGMGGMRCLEQLLKIDPAARIIVVSGYTNEQPPGGFTGIGAREFVTKPYDMVALSKVIRKVMDN